MNAWKRNEVLPAELSSPRPSNSASEPPAAGGGLLPLDGLAVPLRWAQAPFPHLPAKWGMGSQQVTCSRPLNSENESCFFPAASFRRPRRTGALSTRAVHGNDPRSFVKCESDAAPRVPTYQSQVLFFLVFSPSRH